MSQAIASAGRLRAVPLSAFAIVMGMTGLAIAWLHAASILSLPAVIGDGLLIFSVAVFCILGVTYGAKALLYPDAVAAELGHPVKRNFLPAVTIGVMLTSIAVVTKRPALSAWLWMAGAPAHLMLTLWVISTWIDHVRHEIAHVNPTWFIPVVGNIMVPVVGVQHAPAEVSWFYFSFAVMFWLILTTIIFYRVIFHDPIPERLMPTLFILIAPPAVGFVAYIALTGEFDVFARVLYYAALFLTLLLACQVRRFSALSFSLSWWAYSFPVAAITIATLEVYSLTGLAFFRYLSVVFLALVSILLFALTSRTLLSIGRGEFADGD